MFNVFVSVGQDTTSKDRWQATPLSVYCGAVAFACKSEGTEHKEPGALLTLR